MSRPGLGLLRRGGAAVIPDVVTGQTLLFRETWDTVPTAGSPGPWASWADGDITLTGAVDGGPTVYDIDGVTRRKVVVCVEQPTAAQSVAGYTLPTTYWGTTSGNNNGDTILTEFWIRPGPATQFPAVPVFGNYDEFGNALEYVRVEVVSSDQTRFRLNSYVYNGAGNVNSDWYAVGEWVRIWFAVTKAGRRTCYYAIPSLGVSATMLDDASTSPSWPPTLRLRFGSLSPASANQPWFSGQIGPISCYLCTSYAIAAAGSADYLPPGNGRTYAATNFADACDKVNKSVVMGGGLMLRSGGSYTETDDRTSAGANHRRDVLFGCADGTTSHNPRYDRVTIPAGVDRPDSDTAWTLRAVPMGVRVTGAGSDPSGTHTDLRATELLADSWTDMAAAGTYPVFRYDGTQRVKAHLWAPGRVELVARFAADFTAAGPLLDDYPWQCWVDSSGTAYVSVPAGTTPSDYGTWERFRRPASGNLIPDLGGAWVSDLMASGVGDYNYQNVTPATDRLNGQYIWYTSAWLYVPTVLQNLRGYGHTKHIFARTSAANRGACAFLSPRWGGNAVRVDGTAFPPTYSAGGGDYSSLVSYSGGSETPGTAVDVYDEPDRVEGFFYALPGEAQGSGEDQQSRTSPQVVNGGIFYTHGAEASGIDWPFALIAFRWATVIDDFFASGSPPAPPVSGATYPADGSNYADFQVNGVSNPAP